MKRLIVLCALISIGALSMTVAAYQPPAAQAATVVTVEKLKDNLFVLRGGGGNTAVFVTANGAVVVDAKNPRLGQADSRQDQRADAQAGDDADQHPHARRPCERQRGFSRRRLISSCRRTRKPTWKVVALQSLPFGTQLDATAA